MFLLSHVQIQLPLLQTAFQVALEEKVLLCRCLEVNLHQDKGVDLGNQVSLKDTHRMTRSTKGQSSRRFNEASQHRANGQIQALAECQTDHRRWVECLDNASRELYQMEFQVGHRVSQ